MQYIDYVGSWGPAIVGHAHPEVTEALAEQIKKVGASVLTNEVWRIILACMHASLFRLRRTISQLGRTLVPA